MASPNAQGKPINIAGSPNLEPPPNLRSPRGSNAQRTDVSAEQLAEVRSAYEHYGSSPPIRNIPPPRSASASGAASPVAGRSYRPESSLSRGGHGSSAVSLHSNAPARDGASSDDLTDAQKARIVRKHLMNRGEQEAARKAEELGEGPSSTSLTLDEEDESSADVSGNSEHEAEEYPMPFHLQGGDVHHELYKWHQRQQQQQGAQGSNARPGMGFMSQTLPDLRAAVGRARAASIATASRRGSDATSRGIAVGRTEDGDISYRDIMQPGGFRRAYIHQKRAAAGKRPLPDNGHRVTRRWAAEFFRYLEHDD